MATANRKIRKYQITRAIEVASPARGVFLAKYACSEGSRWVKLRSEHHTKRFFNLTRKATEK